MTVPGSSASPISTVRAGPSIAAGWAASTFHSSTATPENVLPLVEASRTARSWVVVTASNVVLWKPLVEVP
ncbi:hypothetical protein D3C74_405170 [compost metagenome]